MDKEASSNLLAASSWDEHDAKKWGDPKEEERGERENQHIFMWRIL
jgi:hypothetical protein